MVKAQWLRGLYPLYLRIRLHSPLTSFVQWSQVLTVFIQFSILPIYVQTPAEYLRKFDYTSPLPYLQSIVFFNTWLFSTTSLILNNLIFFALFIIFYSVWIYVIICTQKGKYISHPTMVFIRFFQQILAKVITFPLLYKFVSTAQICYESSDPTNYVSMVIATLNLIFNGFNIFISSVFLDSADFVFASKVDTYDGKNQFSLYITKFLIVTSYAAFAIFNNPVLYSIMASIMVLLVIYIFYIRVFSKATVSYLGSFFETAPFVAIPFHVVIHIFFDYPIWIVAIGTTIIIYLIYAIFIYYFSKYTEKKSIRVFSGFIKKNSEPSQEKELPTFTSGSHVSILRNIAAVKNDPTIFERFLLLQKRVGYVTSQLLEITRFLALFPSKREGLITLLENQQTKSAYNQWMVYLFLERLKLLVTSDDERDYPEIKMLIDTYIIYYQRFWQCRCQKKRFQALHEALRATFYSRELSISIRDYVRLCPKDSVVYYNLAMFYLYMEADYEGSINLRITSNEIKQKKYHVLDPILSKMSITYPKILQFCGPSELKMSRLGPLKHPSENSYGMTETSVSNSSADANRPIGTPNIIPEYNVKVPYIESKIVASKENMPWNSWLMHVAPMICLAMYFISILPFSRKNDELGNTLITNVNNTIQSLYNSTASLYISALKDIGFDNSKNNSELQCQYEILMLPNKVISFIAKMPDIQELSKLILPLTFDLFKDQTNSEQSSCEFMNSLDSKMLEITRNKIDCLNQTSQIIYDSIDDLSHHIYKGYNALPHTSVFLCVFILIAILLLVTVCQVNSKLDLNNEVMEYISSDTRRRRSLRTEYDEVFDDLEQLIIKKKNELKQNPLSLSTGNLQVKFDGEKPKKSGTSDIKESTLNLINSKKMPRNASNALLLRRRSFEEKPEEPPIPKPTDEELDLESEKIFQRSKHSAWRIYIEMFVTLFIIIIVCFAFVAILSNRSAQEKDEIAGIYDKTPTVMHTLEINSMLLSIIEGKRPDGLADLIQDLNSAKDPDIHQIYTADVCYSLNSLTCTKISDLLSDLTTVDINDNGIILETFTPILMKFQRKMLNSIIQDVSAISKIPHSPFSSFILCIIFISLFVIVFAVQWYNNFRKALNCLFNFPGDKDDETSIGNEKEPEKSTNKIIIVSAITETGEIYSISENTMRILGRYPVDFITQDINETFQVLDDSHRQYTMPDRRTKRIFRYITVNRKYLTKLIMIEEPNNEVQGVEAVTQKMSAVMPAHYAKIFAEEGQIMKIYPNCVIIIIKISLNPQSSVIDRFFNVVNMLSQNFGKVKLLRSEANFLFYLNENIDSPLSAFLFARDILVGTSSKMKIPHDSGEFPIDNIIILNIHDLKLELVESVEPFLGMSSPDIPGCEEFMMSIEPKKIALCPVVAEVPNVGGFGGLTDTVVGPLYLSNVLYSYEEL